MRELMERETKDLQRIHNLRSSHEEVMDKYPLMHAQNKPTLAFGWKLSVKA